MILIDGKKIAAELREELKKEVSSLKTKYNKVPGLSVILIGDLTQSQIYVKNKEKFANEVGLKSEVIKYPDSVKEKVILDKISELNNDVSVSGILVQLPLPKHINKQKINDDLDECWEILAEPIQMVARKYQISNSYEYLKKYTRGKKVDKGVIEKIITNLHIPENEKRRLLELTPRKYIGYANKLCDVK